jgi:hypothetical protein
MTLSQFSCISTAEARTSLRKLSGFGKMRTAWVPPLDLLVESLEHIGGFHMLVVRKPSQYVLMVANMSVVASICCFLIELCGMK